MNDIVAEAFAAELAQLTRDVDLPVAPLGYGSDISCGQDLDAEMTDLDGFDHRILAQAAARRLDCPRGSLPDDPDYGIDLRDMLHEGLTEQEIRAMKGKIGGELRKDDRFEAVSVEVIPSLTVDGLRLRIELKIVPRDARFGGPFSMTLALSSAGVLIEEMSR